MKIKTNTTKTAPEPSSLPPLESPRVVTVNPGPKFEPSRKGCCATWTKVDKVLMAFIVIFGVLLIFSLIIPLFAEMYGNDVERHHEAMYSPAKCKVVGVVSQGPVCCRGGCRSCQRGIKQKIGHQEVYDFMDGPTKTCNKHKTWWDKIMEMENEKREEFVREKEVEIWKSLLQKIGHIQQQDAQWKAIMQKLKSDDFDLSVAELDRLVKEIKKAGVELTKEEWGMIVELYEELKEDKGDMEDKDRTKRSMNGYFKSFSCYKIVMEAACANKKGFGEESHEEGHDDDKEGKEERGHERGHHKDDSESHEDKEGHDKSHKEGHERRRRDDHHRPGMNPEEDMDDGGRRPPPHHGRGSHERDDHHEGKDEMHNKEHHDEDKDGDKPEKGIIVVGKQEKSVNGVYKVTFYDSKYTMLNFAQCSYSACSGATKQNCLAVEKKVKKWKTRMEKEEVFPCSYRHEQHHERQHGDRELRHFSLKMLRLTHFLFGLPLAVLVVVFIVRRCAACKRRNQQTSSTDLYRPETPAVKTKEQEIKELEANALSTTPRVGWPSAPPQKFLYPTEEVKTGLPKYSFPEGEQEEGKTSPPPEYTTTSVNVWSTEDPAKDAAKATEDPAKDAEKATEA